MLHAEAAGWWDAYLAEKRLGNAANLNNAKQEELLRIYKLTAARERVHRNQAHPQKDGHAVSLDDLALTAEFEWSSTLVLGYVNR